MYIYLYIALSYTKDPTCTFCWTLAAPCQYTYIWVDKLTARVRWTKGQKKWEFCCCCCWRILFGSLQWWIYMLFLCVCVCVRRGFSAATGTTLWWCRVLCWVLIFSMVLFYAQLPLPWIFPFMLNLYSVSTHGRYKKARYKCEFFLLLLNIHLKNCIYISLFLFVFCFLIRDTQRAQYIQIVQKLPIKLHCLKICFERSRN